MSTLIQIEELTKALDKKETEINLHVERSDLILEACQAGTWEWLLKPDQLLWNERMVELWGYNAEDFDKTKEGYFILNYSLFITGIEEKYREEVTSLVNRTISEKEFFSINYTVIQPDGTKVKIHASGHAYPKDAEHPDRLLGVCLQTN